MMGATLNSFPDVAIFAEFSLTNILQCAEESLFAGMEDRQLAPYSHRSIEQILRPTVTEHGTEFTNAIYRLVYPKKILRILGNKIPSMAAGENIDYLLTKIPDLKIIYIVRNCSSVVQSSMARREGAERQTDTWLFANEREAIDEWIYSLFVGRYIAKRANVLFIKYEDLLSNPAGEANRIKEFIGVSQFNFSISQPSKVVRPLPTGLAAYSDALASLLEHWDEMPTDEIIAYPLDAELSRLCWGWRPMNVPLCDIGTHENFHRPEPWGCWSMPGYFALRPRFCTSDANVAQVVLHFYETKADLEAADLRCSIGPKPAKIVDIVERGDCSYVVVEPLAPCSAEGFLIDVFFAVARCWAPDPRRLGLRLRRYRLLSDADDIARLAMR
jgi:hypothetical protein